MADLIDQTRAERNLAYTGTAVGEFTDAQEALINALIAAGSRAIKKHCGRELTGRPTRRPTNTSRAAAWTTCVRNCPGWKHWAAKG